jgi:DNA-damage-inducible protein J
MYPVCDTVSLTDRGSIMSKGAMVRARIEPDLKHHAETVFHRLGLNPAQAITIFYKQVELRGGLPFDVAIPTATTKRTFETSDAGRGLVICEDADDMFEKLGI